MRFKKSKHVFILLSIISLLTACDGGGIFYDEPDKGSPNAGNKIILNEEVVVANTIDLAPNAVMEPVGKDKSSVIISPDSKTFKSLKKDTTLYIPPSKHTGLGFSGVVDSVSPNGTVIMRPATISEVFDELDLDINTTRRGQAQLLGVIPANSNTEINVTESAHQLGVTSKNDIDEKTVNCLYENMKYQLLEELLKPDFKKYKNKIESEHKEIQSYSIPGSSKDTSVGVSFTNKCMSIRENKYAEKNEKIGSNYTVNFTLKRKNRPDFFAKVSLNDVIFSQVIKFKNNKWEKFDSRMSGRLVSEVGFTGSAKSTRISQLLGADDGKGNVWDTLKWKIGGQYASAELYGLDSTDKKGLLPLGGFVWGLGTAISGLGHPGDITPAEINTNKMAALVIWFYLKADGQIVLDGTIKTGADMSAFNRRVQLIPTGKDGKALRLKNTMNYGDPSAYLSINGKAELKGSLGLVTPSVDLILLGVRPVSAIIEPVKYDLETKLEGKGEFVWFSKNAKKPYGISGQMCASQSSSLYSNVSVLARLGASVKAFGFNKKSEFTWIYSIPFPWKNKKEEKICTYSDKIRVYYEYPYPYVGNSQNELDVKINFREMYNRHKDNDLIDEWYATTFSPIPERLSLSNLDDGEAIISLAPNKKHKVVVTAFSSKYGVVAESKTFSLDLPPLNTEKINISSIVLSPVKPIAGQQYQITILGTHLPNGSLNIEGCNNMLLTSTSVAQHVYQCMAPSAVGNQEISIKTADGKTILGTSSYEVEAPTPTPQITSISTQPQKPTLNSQFEVAVMGSDLASDMKLDGCVNQKLLSATKEKVTYQCDAPSAVGNQEISIKTADGKTVLASANFEVVDNSIPVTTSKLTATGITTCGTADDSSNRVDCSTAVDNATKSQVPKGQDGHYQAGQKMSYTIVTQNGEQCVKDNVTGLMWEVKQGGDDIQGNEGLHDADDTYNWYSDTNNNGNAGYKNDDGAICYGYNANNESTFCNTQAYVTRVNSIGWCGHSDWRLPTFDEISSIVDNSRVKPAIDVDYFPNTKTAGRYYWSSSPSALNNYSAWVVGFGNGHGNSNGSSNYKGNGDYVRLVRGGQ